MKADIVIVGGGVAGLVAAIELQRAGLQVVLLEARERMGGRILSRHLLGQSRPVDLGAEFVHGGSAAVWAYIKRSHLSVSTVEEKHWRYESGTIVPADDMWDEIEQVMKGVGPFARQRGESLGSFLREAGEAISENERSLTINFVEGFEAAPVERMSAAALSEGARATKSQQFRLNQGYGALLAKLEEDFLAKDSLKLGAIVTDVHWTRGHVEVRARAAKDQGVSSYSARAALLTLPLGVLQAAPPALGAVRFIPPLGAKADVINGLAMGNVARTILRFRENFWVEDVVPAALRAEEGRAFGFVHAPLSPVPVWWSLAPSPILVGWLGGPSADRFLALAMDEQIDRALASLAEIFQVDLARLRTLFVDGCSHDWPHDPFTRGAYTYAVAGAENAPAHLAESLEQTLFFAGEATAELGDLGTVHGAWETGLRAAREIVETLH